LEGWIDLSDFAHQKSLLLFPSFTLSVTLSKNPQAAADGPHMAKAAAACGVLRCGGGLLITR